MTLEELFRGSNYDLADANRRLIEVAKAEGLPYANEHKMTYRTREAQELAKWAESLGKGDEFHAAVFKAVFVDDLNIGLPEVLFGIIEAIGLREEAEGNHGDESFSEAVTEDWEYCRKLGVTAVPTFIYKGRAIVGAQPYEALKQLVEESGPGPSPFNILRS